MATPTGGGGKFTIIKKKFDPTKATLREVVEMYIKESKDLGDGKNHRIVRTRRFLIDLLWSFWNHL